MKLYNYLLPAVAFAAAVTSCDSCDLSPVLPPVQPPVVADEAQHAPTMTILEFKQQFWSSQSDSMEEIGLTEEGDSIYLRGRVVSTDITGNCYKQLILRDETAAILFQVGINDIYKVYPYGTDVCVNVTGLYVGMYRNLLQVGSKQEGRTSPYQVAEDDFEAVATTYGWPAPDEAQPVETDLAFLKSIKSDAAGRQEWQSQLVTIKGVKFEAPGQEFSPTYSSTVSQYVRDGAGNSLILRFSGRSSFAHRIMPAGTGDVTGILSFYNADWQLIPCTLEDLQGFTEVASSKATFTRATTIADGQYIIWFEGNKVAVPFSDGKDFGWMNVESCSPEAGGAISASKFDLFTFKKEAKGWTIMDSNNQYIYQDSGRDNFQVSKSPDMTNNNTYWDITAQADGSFSIVNCGTGKTVRYSAAYNSCGAYADLSRGTASYLYQPVNN